MTGYCQKLHLKLATKNLVSDGFQSAEVIDPRLINAWGIVVFDNTLWVASNDLGLILNYNLDGAILPTTINVPGGNPTGIVINKTPNFLITNGFVTLPATFLIATENGIIAGYNYQVDPINAIIVVNNSGINAVYKGLAIAKNKLYATDFFNNRIDVFDGQYNPLVGYNFTDPTIKEPLPPNYAPFNIMNINNKLFVTYAQQLPPANEEVQNGEGNGIINVFDAFGVFICRLVTRGALNSPWGMAIAPDNWKDAACALLVANFGDGRINVYDYCGKYLGYLRDKCGQPIYINGLWGIFNYKHKIYFAAGPNDELNGTVGVVKKLEHH